MRSLFFSSRPHSDSRLPELSEFVKRQSKKIQEHPISEADLRSDVHPTRWWSAIDGAFLRVTEENACAVNGARLSDATTVDYGQEFFQVLARSHKSRLHPFRPNESNFLAITYAAVTARSRKSSIANY